MTMLNKAGHRSIRILLIEDDEDDYILVQALLQEIKNWDIHLDWISKSSEAREAISRCEHDVYLIDYYLGEANGIELISEAVSNGNRSPMILMTGKDDRDIDFAATKSGAADYLPKGRVDSETIERTMRYALAQSAILNDLQKSYEELEKHRHHLDDLVRNRTLKLAFVNKELQDDIIKRKELELELRAGRANFESIVDKNPNANLIVDTEGIVRFANSSVRELFGCSKEDLIGNAIGRPIVVDNSAELEVLHGNREIRTVELIARDTEWEGKKAHLIIFHDITARKRAEEELEKHRDHLEETVKERTSELSKTNQVLQREIFERMHADEVLREAHKRNGELLASISSILICVRPNELVSYWNAAAETAFKIPATDTVGKSFSKCGIRWDWYQINASIQKLQKKHEPVKLNEIPFMRSDGREGFLNITLSPFSECDQHEKGMLLLGEDVTDRKAMEFQLVQAQKLESIGQLAAGIAHEINTPIQYVGDNTHFMKDAFEDLSQLLLKYGKLREAIEHETATDEIIREIEAAVNNVDVEYLMDEVPKSIGQTLEGVDRVANIVRAMKAFSHPGTVHKVAHDINKIIDDTATISRNEWKYVAEMVLNLDHSLPMVPCLAADLNQVVLNLIVNAAHAIGNVIDKASDEKGFITITTRQVGNWAEILVADTGTGIPEAARGKIFDPFFTTKDVGMGSGQGLAIAHVAVVKGHGGIIDFETEEGKGTTFSIRLPIEIEEFEGEKNEETNSHSR